MESGALYKLEGSVEAVIFHSEETGFTVLEMAAGDELVTVVGEFADIAAGETLIVTGTYGTHPKYGMQLRAQAYERLMPATASAIAQYLASGAIKGVGPATAKKLVQAFGDETLAVIEEDPQRLANIGGISLKKAEQISNEYKKIFGIRTVMAFLAKYGVDAARAMKVWKKFGPAAQEIVLQNPYALCMEEIGVPFEQADAIALAQGVRQDGYERVAAALAHILRHNTGNGHVCLPCGKLEEVCARLLEIEPEQVEQGLQQAVERGELVRLEVLEEGFIYLPQYYEAECYIAGKLSLLKDGAKSQTAPPDAEELVSRYEQEQELVYAPLQHKAIVTALTAPVMILTGGPGTGKTTAISAMIGLLGKMGQKVALAAPTGRAAKRMSDLTGVEAKTVHRLLEVDFADGGVHKFKRNEKNPLPNDAVIIDECSMMDTLLFESLLRALPLSCRLVLVGDPDQLPSVGAGNILQDLIESGCIPVVHLSEIFRQAAESLIITNAHAIVAGEYPELDVRDKDFFFIADRDTAHIAATAADLCVRRLPARYGYSPLWDIQVLAPTRVGALGTGELNRVLQQALNPPDPGKKEFGTGPAVFREGDKVMQIKNNYDILWKKDDGEDGLGIFNGDIGVIEMIDRPSSSMLIRFEDRVAEYSFEMASELELAYAVTVHKSQGNEYDAVILPLMNGRSRMYYRNLLYTAVTRAKKLLIILGSRAAVCQMVDNHKKTRRYTNLVYLMGEVDNG